MICAMCNGNIIIKNDFLQFRSKTLGEINIPNVEFEECQTCRKQLLSPDAADYVTNYVRDQEQIAIGQLPSSDLVTATEAAAILGVTKQRFSQNKKIKRGFIYFVMVGNRRAYFRKSVELFKQTGDGRFSLKAPYISTSTAVPYVTILSPEVQPERLGYLPQEEPDIVDIWCNHANYITRTGNEHANC